MKIKGYFAFLAVTSCLLACSNGGGGSGAGPAPQKPPLSENILNQYGGQKFNYTSPDGTCTSSIQLYSGDNGQMTVQDSGPCPVLFNETFSLACADDRTCTGRINKYAATVTLSLDSDTAVTFTVVNDTEQKNIVTTYQIVQ